MLNRRLTTLLKYMKDISTEKDGVSYCLASMLILGGGLAMIFEFLYRGSTDYAALGVGLTSLVLGKTVKTYVEGKNGP